MHLEEVRSEKRRLLLELMARKYRCISASLCQDFRERFEEETWMLEAEVTRCIFDKATSKSTLKAFLLDILLVQLVNCDFVGPSWERNPSSVAPPEDPSIFSSPPCFSSLGSRV